MDTKIDKVHLSVVIPAYNAAGILERNLPVLTGYLSGQDYKWEIIIVDDGTDDNGETAGVAQIHGCRYSRNPCNMGKGASVRNGMSIAAGDFRIFTDADIPYEPSVIGEMMKYLEPGTADLAIGDRHLRDSNYPNHPSFLRTMTSLFFTAFVGTIVTTSFFDTQCGIKGFRAATADFLFKRSVISGFAFDVELIYMALKNDFVIKRIPVRLRNNEESTVRVLKHGAAMFSDLFRIKVNHLKGRYNP